MFLRAFSQQAGYLELEKNLSCVLLKQAFPKICVSELSASIPAVVEPTSLEPFEPKLHLCFAFQDICLRAGNLTMKAVLEDPMT